MPPKPPHVKIDEGVEIDDTRCVIIFCRYLYQLSDSFSLQVNVQSLGNSQGGS